MDPKCMEHGAPAAGLVFCGFGTQHPKAKLRDATDPNAAARAETPDRTQREKRTRHGEDPAISAISVISVIFHHEEPIILQAFLVPSDYADDLPKEWWSQAP